VSIVVPSAVLADRVLAKHVLGYPTPRRQTPYHWADSKYPATWPSRSSVCGTDGSVTSLLDATSLTLPDESGLQGSSGFSSAMVLTIRGAGARYWQPDTKLGLGQAPRRAYVGRRSTRYHLSRQSPTWHFQIPDTASGLRIS
jgi:hypothetical protein